jgi:hypothetical protein
MIRHQETFKMHNLAELKNLSADARKKKKTETLAHKQG